MPRLSVPQLCVPKLCVRCVVTHHDGHRQQSRRDTWIDAHDFGELALAATAQLRVPPDRCEYRLFVPDVGTAYVGVLLEVVHDGLSALVGPMGGPAVPASLDGEHGCTFPELIARTGFDAEAGARGMHPVTVVYAGLLDRLAGEPAFPLARAPGESAAGYRARCAEATRVRLARGRHEGFHALPYAALPADWRAEDLEALLGRLHALLPACEPRWRESGTIRREPAAPGTLSAAGTIRCALEVQRGDFVACLRLPAFPVSALAEWLACRPCEISLCHPMATLPRASSVRERAPACERGTVPHDHERTAGLAAACLRWRPVAWALVEGGVESRLRGAGGDAPGQGASHDLGDGAAPYRLDSRGGPADRRRRAGAA